jgi:hypothetical protein
MGCSKISGLDRLQQDRLWIDDQPLQLRRFRLHYSINANNKALRLRVFDIYVLILITDVAQ